MGRIGVDSCMQALTCVLSKKSTKNTVGYGPHTTSVCFQNSSHKGRKLHQAKDPRAVRGTEPWCRVCQVCVDKEDFKFKGESQR